MRNVLKTVREGKSFQVDITISKLTNVSKLESKKSYSIHWKRGNKKENNGSTKMVKLEKKDEVMFEKRVHFLVTLYPKKKHFLKKIIKFKLWSSDNKEVEKYELDIAKHSLFSGGKKVETVVLKHEKSKPHLHLHVITYCKDMEAFFQKEAELKKCQDEVESSHQEIGKLQKQLKSIEYDLREVQKKSELKIKQMEDTLSKIKKEHMDKEIILITEKNNLNESLTQIRDSQKEMERKLQESHREGTRLKKMMEKEKNSTKILQINEYIKKNERLEESSKSIENDMEKLRNDWMEDKKVYSAFKWRLESDLNEKETKILELQNEIKSMKRKGESVRKSVSFSSKKIVEEMKMELSKEIDKVEESKKSLQEKMNNISSIVEERMEVERFVIDQSILLPHKSMEYYYEDIPIALQALILCLKQFDFSLQNLIINSIKFSFKNLKGFTMGVDKALYVLQLGVCLLSYVTINENDIEGKVDHEWIARKYNGIKLHEIALGKWKYICEDIKKNKKKLKEEENIEISIKKKMESKDEDEDECDVFVNFPMKMKKNSCVSFGTRLCDVLCEGFLKILRFFVGGTDRIGNVCVELNQIFSRKLSKGDKKNISNVIIQMDKMHKLMKKYHLHHRLIENFFIMTCDYIDNLFFNYILNNHVTLEEACVIKMNIGNFEFFLRDKVGVKGFVLSKDDKDEYVRFKYTTQACNAIINAFSMKDFLDNKEAIVQISPDIEMNFLKRMLSKRDNESVLFERKISLDQYYKGKEVEYNGSLLVKIDSKELELEKKVGKLKLPYYFVYSHPSATNLFLKC